MSRAGARVLKGRAGAAGAPWPELPLRVAAPAEPARGCPPAPVCPDPEAIRAEAYRAGYDEGLRAGRAEGEALRREAEELLRKAEAARAEVAQVLERERERLWQELREDVAALAMAVARRVLERELSATSAEDALALVERLLAEAGGQEGVRVRVHPRDAYALEAAQPALEARAGAPVAVVGDASLRPGDAVVETASGSWDARLETRLQGAEAGLRAGLGLAGEGVQP